MCHVSGRQAGSHFTAGTGKLHFFNQLICLTTGCCCWATTILRYFSALISLYQVAFFSFLFAGKGCARHLLPFGQVATCSYPLQLRLPSQSATHQSGQTMMVSSEGDLSLSLWSIPLFGGFVQTLLVSWHPSCDGSGGEDRWKRLQSLQKKHNHLRMKKKAIVSENRRRLTKTAIER